MRPKKLSGRLTFVSIAWLMTIALASSGCVPRSVKEVPVEAAKPRLPPPPAWAYEEPQYEKTLRSLLFESVPTPTPDSDSAEPTSSPKRSDARR